MKLYEKPVARSVEMHIKTKCAYYDTTGGGVVWMREKKDEMIQRKT